MAAFVCHLVGDDDLEPDERMHAWCMVYAPSIENVHDSLRALFKPRPDGVKRCKRLYIDDVYELPGNHSGPDAILAIIEWDSDIATHYSLPGDSAKSGWKHYLPAADGSLAPEEEAQNELLLPIFMTFESEPTKTPSTMN